MTNPKPDLTPKQAKFVQQYGLDMNATQAAKRAGYSARTAKVIGAENLTKPAVAAAIRAAQAKLAERTEISQEWVIKNLRLVAERSMSVDAVTLDGKETGEFVFNAAGATRALELLGKHIGMFVDRLEVGRAGEFGDLSDAEFAERYRRQLEQYGVDAPIAARLAQLPGPAIDRDAEDADIVDGDESDGAEVVSNGYTGDATQPGVTASEGDELIRDQYAPADDPQRKASGQTRPVPSFSAKRGAAKADAGPPPKTGAEAVTAVTSEPGGPGVKPVKPVAEVVAVLRIAIAHEPSLRAWATKNGLSHTIVSLVLNGKRKPPASVRKALGLA